MKTLSPTASAPLAPLTAPAPGTVWLPQDESTLAPVETFRDPWASDPDRMTRLGAYRTF